MQSISQAPTMRSTLKAKTKVGARIAQEGKRRLRAFNWAETALGYQKVMTESETNSEALII